MRNVTTLSALLCLLFVGTAYGQEPEYILSFPSSAEFGAPYTTGLHSGARGVMGPYDLDGDGRIEVLATDYTGGGRVHVVENTGVDTWEHVYSTPVLDSTSASNVRYAIGADLDGDGMGEIVFVSGNGFSQFNPDIADRPVGVYVFEYTGTDNDYGDAPTVVFPIESPSAGQTPGSLPEQLHAFDVDGDGVQELLIPSNTISAFDIFYIMSVTGDIGSGFEVLNVEREVLPRTDTQLGGGSPYSAIPADLDGDGTYEISFHTWNNFNFFNADVTGADTYVLPAAGAANSNFKATAGDQVSLFSGVAVDINNDGDDEVFYPNYHSFSGRQVAVVNYEDGEDVLQISGDQVKTAVIPGFTQFGIAAGDLDGDGRPELVGTGPSFLPTADELGQPSFFIQYAQFIGGDGGDPEDPSNYVVRAFNTGSVLDTLAFDIVHRDSAGVMSRFFVDAGTSPVFPTKIAFLGDADGDGNAEIAVGFQGQDDSLTVFDEAYVEGVGDELYRKTTANLSDFLGTGTTERSLAYNAATGNIILASRKDGGVHLYAFAAGTGEIIDTLSTTGVGGSGILFPINEVDVTEDGQIFATGLTLADGSNYKVYWWKDEFSDPVAIFEGPIDGAPRLGDGIGVEGEGDETTVYLSGTGSAVIAKFEFSATDTTIANGAPSFIPITTSAARGGIAPTGDGRLWINGGGTEAMLISAEDGAVLGSVADASVSMDIAYASTPNGDIIAVGPNSDQSFQVFDVTDPAAPRLIGTTASLDEGGANGFVVGDVSFGGDGKTLYALSTNNAFAAFPVSFGYERTVRERMPVATRVFMRIYDSSTATVADERGPQALPEEITLSANYPNPFNPTTTFDFTLPQEARVTVRVYDVMGRVVKTLVRGETRTPGTYRLTWDATNDAGQSVASGTYFYAVEHATGRIAKPMVLVK